MHKSAEQLNNRCIKAVSHNCWMVESQEREEFYTVGGSQSSSGPCSCKLKCTNCEVCPHMYTCTCLDSVLHNTACKHIHFVHMTTVQTLMTANENLHSNEANTIDSDKEYSVSFQEYVTVDTIRQSVDGNSTTATETLLSTCKELQLLIPKVSDTNAIKNATKSMRSIISLLKGTLEGNRETRLIPTSTYAANTNNQKQMRFHSTKKKREKHSVEFAFKKMMVALTARTSTGFNVLSVVYGCMKSVAIQLLIFHFVHHVLSRKSYIHLLQQPNKLDQTSLHLLLYCILHPSPLHFLWTLHNRMSLHLHPSPLHLLWTLLNRMSLHLHPSPLHLLWTLLNRMSLHLHPSPLHLLWTLLNRMSLHLHPHLLWTLLNRMSLHLHPSPHHLLQQSTSKKKRESV